MSLHPVKSMSQSLPKMHIHCLTQLARHSSPTYLSLHQLRTQYHFLSQILSLSASWHCLRALKAASTFNYFVETAHEA